MQQVGIFVHFHVHKKRFLTQLNLIFKCMRLCDITKLSIRKLSNIKLKFFTKHLPANLIRYKKILTLQSLPNFHSKYG